MKILIFLSCSTILLTFQPTRVASRTTDPVKVQLLSFENPSEKSFTGACCDVPCSDKCDTFFKICLHDAASPESECMEGKNASVAMGAEFGENLLEVEYELTSLDMELSLKIVALDIDPGRYDVIDYVTTEIKRGSDQVLTLEGMRQFEKTKFVVNITFKCDEYYYGPMCDIWCKPRDDYMGHYECDTTTGRKTCLQGWTGPDCRKPLVKCVDQVPLLATPGICQAIDLIFILDSSRSLNNIDPENWQRAKNLVKASIDRVTLGPIAYQVGVVSFSTRAELSIKLSDSYSPSELKDKIDELPYMGEKTNLRAGLSLTRMAGLDVKNGRRPFATPAVVLVYDGEKPTPEFGTLMSEADKLKSQGVDVTVVSLDYYFSKGLADKQLVEQMASEPLATHLFADLPDWSKLESTIAPTILANLQDSCMRKNKPQPGTGTTAAASTQPPAPQPSTAGAAGQELDIQPDVGCGSRGFCSAASKEASKCHCMPGWTGRSCEFMLNPCMSDPCHGGECTNLGGTDYMCTSCPEGYSGSKCETAEAGTVSCAGDPCKDGGENCPQPPTASETCPAVADLPCAQFFYGEECDVVCVPVNNCWGHYECSKLGEKVCLEGWEDPSTNCTTWVGENQEECTPSCTNGGICFNQGCCCPAGFSGLDCSGSNDNVTMESLTTLAMSWTSGLSSVGTGNPLVQTGTTVALTGTMASGSTTLVSGSMGMVSGSTGSQGTEVPGTMMNSGMTEGNTGSKAMVTGTTEMNTGTAGTDSVAMSGTAVSSSQDATGSEAVMTGTDSTFSRLPTSFRPPTSFLPATTTLSDDLSPPPSISQGSSSGAATMSSGASSAGPQTSAGAETTGSDDLTTEAFNILKYLGEYIENYFPELTSQDKSVLLNQLLDTYLTFGSLPTPPTDGQPKSAALSETLPIFVSEKWNGTGQLTNYFVQLEVTQLYVTQHEDGTYDVATDHRYIITDQQERLVVRLGPEDYAKLSAPGNGSVHDYIITTPGPEVEPTLNDTKTVVIIAIVASVGGVLFIILLVILTWRLVKHCQRKKSPKDKENLCRYDSNSFIGHGTFNSAASIPSDVSQGSIRSKMQYVEP